MNNLDILITDTAKNDIKLIIEYISKDKPNIAQKLLLLFKKAFLTLSSFPDLGVKRPDFTYKDVMFFVIKKKYLIAYKVDNKNLKILRVLTTYQDIYKLL